MTRTKSTFLALVAVLLSPTAANADPIPVVTPCPIFFTGGCLDQQIGNLDIDGVAYDVEIVNGSFPDLFPDQAALDSLTFWNDPLGAAAAALAIADLLTDLSIEGILSEGTTSISGGALILYDVFGSTQSFWSVESTDFFGASGIWEPLDRDFSVDSSGSYVFFTPTSVPEPGILALFGIGFLAMAARRKKKV